MLAINSGPGVAAQFLLAHLYGRVRQQRGPMSRASFFQQFPRDLLVRTRAVDFRAIAGVGLSPYSTCLFVVHLSAATGEGKRVGIGEGCLAAGGNQSADSMIQARLRYLASSASLSCIFAEGRYWGRQCQSGCSERFWRLCSVGILPCSSLRRPCAAPVVRQKVVRCSQASSSYRSTDCEPERPETRSLPMEIS